MKLSVSFASLALAAALLVPQAVLAADASDAGAKAQAIIDKAAHYLKSQQQPDGGWQRSPREPVAITAIVLKALVGDPNYSVKVDWVKKGFDKLLSYQVESGGIYKDSLANYNTAIAVSALAAAKTPDFKDQIEKAVAYLKTLQFADFAEGDLKVDPADPRYGGAGYGKGGTRPDGSNTAMMLDALHDAGIPKDDPRYKAAAKFISRMQNLSETNDQKWAGNDGGAIYSPANNGESFAGEYTDSNGKRLLRSYGSMTYAMLKSYIYCGLSKDDPRVKAAWDWVRKNWTLDENPGLRAGNPADARNGMYYYYLLMARALNAYDEPTIVDTQGDKHDWRVELINKLASIQKEDGSFVGDKRWMEDNPILVTSYALIALEEAKQNLAAHAAK